MLKIESVVFQVFAMKHVLLVSIVVYLSHSVVGKPAEWRPESNCGYRSCPVIDPNALNVHVVPHSHDDVGWLKTVDQYYYGGQTKIQRAGVQYIIDSVVESLLENPERRFIQVETAFLHKWWLEQTAERRQQLVDLVNRGQLEIAGGAWSMNDEAAVHYHSVIDQFTFGLKTLKQMLGDKCYRPRIGWQIDPFGHSKEMADMLAGMGMDGLFFSRLDWRDKSERLTTKTGEMLWQGSSSLGHSSNLFTSVLFNHYSAPSGYCFDVLCSDDPIVDNPNSPEYNYEARVDGYANFIRRQADNYATNNIIITMGDDFNYQDAHSYYKNLDKLIAGFDVFKQDYNGKPIKVFYSTPSCYVNAVNSYAAQNSLSFPLKTDDFMPYASDYHAYWTGYFTSRPTSKRYEREVHNLLQIAKQVAVASKIDSSPEIELLQEAVGIMQHHDAITGTEKQHVADDYARIITEAIQAGTLKISELLGSLVSSGTPINLKLSNCLLANVSVCPETDSNKFSVLVYNPLGRPVSSVVRLPTDNTNFLISNSSSSSITYDVLPSISDFAHLPADLPRSKYDLVFVADQLPALGWQIYTIQRMNLDLEKVPVEDTSRNRAVVGTSMLGFEIDDSSGLLTRIITQGVPFSVIQSMLYYVGALGNNSEFDQRASGAYIFRPSPDEPHAIPFTGPIKFSTYRGRIVDEVHQVFSPWVKQVIRAYHGVKGENHIEIDWLVGPIDIADSQGKEVISRFVTNMATDDKFYTDSNGREMLMRTRNYRPTYKYTNEEPVAGNYYPVTSKITLKDSFSQFSVLNDRAQGGTSLRSGEVELMLHRRLLNDDAFGVGEALVDNEYGHGLTSRGKLFLSFADHKEVGLKLSAPVIEKRIAQQSLLSPWTFITREQIDLTNLKPNTLLAGLALPENVHLLSLEPYDGHNVLFRLEHTFEKDEHNEHSKDVNLDLNNVLNGIVSEMTLDGQQTLADTSRLQWLVGPELGGSRNISANPNFNKETPETGTDALVSLKAMQIRTFVVELKH